MSGLSRRASHRPPRLTLPLTVLLLSGSAVSVFPEPALGLAVEQDAGSAEVIEVPVRPDLLEVGSTPLFSVGRLEGPEHESFGEVTAVAFGPDGRLHVLDRLARRVVVFGPGGEFLHVVGGPGQGPGEFQLPSAITVDGEGHVWVGDLLGSKVELFGPEGSHLETFRFASFGGPELSSLSANGDAAAIVRDRDQSARDGVVAVHRMRIDGSSEEIATAEVPFVPRMEQSGTTFRRVTAPTFTAPLRVVGLPDGGLLRVESATYDAEILRGGVPRTLVRSELAPPPVTEAHREEEKERRRERNREIRENPPPPVGGGFQIRATPDEALERILAEMRFAEVHAAIRNLAVDPEGRIWLQRWGGSPWGEAPIDLVDPDGAGYFGTIPAMEMPDAVGPEGRIARIVEGELGLSEVEVSRLSW